MGTVTLFDHLTIQQDDEKPNRFDLSRPLANGWMVSILDHSATNCDDTDSMTNDGTFTANGKVRWTASAPPPQSKGFVGHLVNLWSRIKEWSKCQIVGCSPTNPLTLTGKVIDLDVAPVAPDASHVKVCITDEYETLEKDMTL